MVIKQFLPPPSLEKIVDYVWIAEIDFLEIEKREDIIMPLGHINIIFNYGSSYLEIKKNKETLIPDAAIIGQIKNAKRVRYGERLNQIGISLKPSGIMYLFNKPTIIFSNKIIKLRDVSTKFYDLYNIINDLDGIDEKIDMIYGYIEKYCFSKKITATKKKKIDRIDRMVEYIELNCENLSIGHMSEFFSLSISTIERFFKKNVGLTPKEYGEIFKFKKNIESYELRKNMQNFYYDQSHLTKKSKKLSGKTMKELQKVQNELTLHYVLNNKK